MRSGIFMIIIWLSVVITWYKPQYWAEAVNVGLSPDIGHCDCEVCDGCTLVGCYDPRTKTMYLDAQGQFVKQGLLHESLHHFYYEHKLDNSAFREIALTYSPELGWLPTYELYAQLPNVLGYVPGDLARWYPWLQSVRAGSDETK